MKCLICDNNALPGIRLCYEHLEKARNSHLPDFEADKCQKKWEHNFAPPAAAVRTWRLGEGVHRSFERLGGVPGQVLDELQRMADEAGCEARLMDHEGKMCLAFRLPAAAGFEHVPAVFERAADLQSNCYYCGRRNCGGHKEKIK